MPFGQQVLVAVARRRQQQIREPIGDDPVDLLGHRAIEAAQAGLDVRDRDQQLRRHQRRRHRRVHVADDDDQVGPLGEADLLERDHHLRGLHRVAAGADAEIAIGRGRSSSLKKPPAIASS